MKKLIDYLFDNKNVSFRKLKLNEIDILAITLLSYLHFDILKNEKPIKLSKLSIIKISEGLPEITRENLVKTFTSMTSSKRFKHIKLINSISDFSLKDNMQFSVTTFSIGRKMFIAFRGTDGTLLGWKENITIGYLEKTPGQEKALEYVSKMIEDHRFHKFFICGHSKGGNLAEFAGLRLNKKQLKKVISIYNFDGPGFIDDDLYNNDLYRDIIKEKIRKYIPRDSIVGVILNKDNCEVVASDVEMAYQHDGFTWLIENNKFKTLPERGEFSIKFENAINAWYYSIERETLKDTIQIMEDIIGKSLDLQVSDIDLKVKTWVIKYLLYKKMEKERKKKVTESLKKLYQLYKDVFKKKGE